MKVVIDETFLVESFAINVIVREIVGWISCHESHETMISLFFYRSDLDEMFNNLIASVLYITVLKPIFHLSDGALRKSSKKWNV